MKRVLTFLADPMIIVAAVALSILVTQELGC